MAEKAEIAEVVDFSRLNGYNTGDVSNARDPGTRQSGVFSCLVSPGVVRQVFFLFRVVAFHDEEFRRNERQNAHVPRLRSNVHLYGGRAGILSGARVLGANTL